MIAGSNPRQRGARLALRPGAQVEDFLGREEGSLLLADKVLDVLEQAHGLGRRGHAVH